MTKRLLTFSLFLLTLRFLLFPAAAGETDAGRMEIQNQTYADNVFSCDVKLSGAAVGGHVFAEVFAQSGRTKKVAEYPAKQTVQVKLTDAASTDYVRVIWTDNAYMPIAGPETRRMPENNAQAYAAFEAALGEKLRSDGIDASAGSNRLLLSCTEELNWSAFDGLDAVVPGPNHHYVLQFENPSKASKCKETLESMSSVRYVEFDSSMTFEKEEESQEETARTLSMYAVIDGRYLESKGSADTADALSWGVERSGIDQYVAALKNKGINRQIVVAVVDSGVDKNHEFLNGVLLDGHSSIPQNSSVQDEYEHGTHVAGIIADCTRGMNVKILPVRVMNKFGSASPSTVANGIYYAANHGANVINLSLGYPEHKHWIDDAIEYALSKNITVVVAACNYNTDAKAFCPAHMEDCITVAALERDGNALKRLGKSNYGSAVDLSAAGGNVYSSIPGNRYLEDSGTSMAAPHVSAAAALLMCERGTSQTPSQISDALKNAAETLTLNKPLGAGFLNMRPFAETTVNVSVKFDANGGAGSMETLTAPYGTEIALTWNQYSRENYLFAYWNTAPDGSGMSYYDGETLTPERDMTLYAQWKPLVSEPLPDKPISWGTTATHMDEYAAMLQQRGMSSEVIVAEIGTGVDASHPFLKGRLIAGYDFVEDDDTPQDEHGHSTYMAGVIADCTPDNVKIMPVRVLDAYGRGKASMIASGIRHAADNGADVICLAFSLTNHSQLIEDAIQYAVSKNITVTVSAGNYNSEASGYCPAHMDECVTVAAVDKSLSRYAISNYGAAVDIAAPGEDIYSCAPDGAYGTMSGTSFAAAYVSGAAAALMCEYGVSQTPAQIANLLKRAAMPLPEDEYDAKRTLGAGFLDMTAFINGGVEEASFYAMLYDDGEMTFQKSAVPDSTKTLLQSYPLSSAEGGSIAQRAAWYSRREQIRTVSFADAIQPVSTALWFHGCENLSEVWGLENLDASLVTDMSQMFSGCGALTFLDLSALNVRSADTLRQMFFECANLTTLDLTGWNTANVTNMSDMFSGCSALETLYASETFTTGAVSDSAGMFDGCAVLSGGAGTKCDGVHTDKEYARVDGGTSAPGYFTDKNAPESGIYAVLYGDGELVFQNNRRTDSARSVTGVYKVDKSYSSDKMPPWYEQRDNIVSVTFADKIQPDSTAYWFYECGKLSEIWYIGNLDTANVTSMRSMFYNCSGLTTLDVSRFDTANVTSMCCMFWGCSALTTLDVSRFDTANVTDTRSMFAYCSALTALDVSRFDTANVTDMRSMFAYCSGLTELDVSRFDTGNVKSMNSMFGYCSGLTTLDVSHFNTANVTDVYCMFIDCTGLTALNVSGFNTAKVTDMRGMFSGCSNLKELDVSGFDTANVTGMTETFWGCSGLSALDVSHFNTANVTDMNKMFYDCSGLSALDVSHFNTANVTDMNRMFYHCRGLTALDLSCFDTANVTDMDSMFESCFNLETIYTSNKFTTASVTSDVGMFGQCAALIGGSGTKYNFHHIGISYARIDGGADAPGYFTAK